MNKLYSPFQPLLTTAGLQRFALSAQERSACNVLNGIVHSYLQISTVKPTPYPTIPDGTQAIFIAPRGSIIGGAQSQASEIQILQPGDYFGIRFYPGALRHFFDVNLLEITDLYVDYKYFPCRNFAQLHNKIYQCHSFQQRSQLCEQWLLRRFRPIPATVFDLALSLIYQSFGTMRISQLAKETGCSSRHLNRQFRFYTGLNTKTFSQIIRLQQACKQLCISPKCSLNTANRLCFFDQAHLLNDFKKRLLSNPSMFFDRFKSDFYNS